MITSPLYPEQYLNMMNCTYVINCPADSSVTIIFDELDTEFEKNCEYDYVAVSGVVPLTMKYYDYTSYYAESDKKQDT